MKRISILFIVLILSSCTQPTSQNATISPTQVMPTIELPSETAEPSVTITQVAVTASPPEGYAFRVHPNKSDIPFVFIYNPELWTFSDSNTEAGNPVVVRFSLRENPACSISTVLGHGIGPSQRLYFQQYGARNWLIYEYSLDMSMVDYKELFLDLSGRMDQKCKDAQQEFLADILSSDEFYSGITAIPYVTPTPRPGLTDFDCAGSLPVLLRVNDTAQVVANSIWLRTEPRRDETTQIKQLLQYSSTLIQIDEGPICVGRYVYWKVIAMGSGEASESISGWMAESDGQEYLLKLFESGW